MAYGSALLALRLLTGDAEAGEGRIPDVEAAQLAEHCKATDPGNNRADVRAFTGEFNEGLEQALEEMSEREEKKALAQALYDALTKANGTTAALVNKDELTKLRTAADATLVDEVNDPTQVDPNRGELQRIQTEVNLDEALLDLILIDGKGKPKSLRQLVRENPDFAELLAYQRAKNFSDQFKDKHKLDCLDAVVYTMKHNEFPALGTDLEVSQAPTWTIDVPYNEGNAPVVNTDWQDNLGQEFKEQEQTRRMVSEQLARAEVGLARFKKRYGIKEKTELVVQPEIKPELKK